MRGNRRLASVVALLFAFAAIAAGCGSDSETGTDSSSPATGGDTESSSTEGTEPASDTAGGGGTLTLGAEQEPDCMDWINTCAGSSWGSWMVNYQTMPRAFDFEKEGDGWVYKPSVLLAGEPEVKADPQVVTYKLNPKAVWDDGTPITCKDFVYTWEQVAKGADVYDPSGYSDVSGVAATDDTTCVVTFSKPYAGWKSLFGGLYGVQPAHLLEGKDRNATMKDGYTFSGGPFKLESWEKGTAITLVPNESYWGPKAKPDKVIFKIIPDTAAAFQAFKAGEVLAIYPQPQIDAIEQINAGLDDVNSVISADTGNLEALWMNNGKAPFDSVAVRQAFGYALDRDAIVKRLFGGIGVEKAVNSLNPPILASLADNEAWSGYKLDLAKVDELMTGDGWAKGADGIWAKGGQRAAIEFKTTAGNKRRELTQQIVQEQAKAAGFELTINNQKAGDLFGQQLPAGDFQLALYAQVLTNLEPSNCGLFCSKNIPTDANGNTGQNWTRTNIPELDPLLEEVDATVDEDARAKANKAADKIQAENMVSLPLDPLPNIGLVSKKIKGDVEENPLTSVFGNMYQWSLN